MRFLVDECAGPALADWLSDQGHDVFSIYHEARGADDETVIQLAFSDNRILVTTDKDFGEKVFRLKRPHHGIILMRLEDERSFVKIETLHRLLASHADQLPGQFVVVTERRIRFARSSA